MFNAQRQSPPTDKPPDPSSDPPSRAAGDAGPKTSIRDMVMGDKPIPPPQLKRDLVAEELMTISFKDGNPLLPQVQLNDKLFEDLCEPWRDAPVIKFLGKNVGYRAMQERLHRLWKPQGGFDILDVDNGYYMVKFDNQVDKDSVTNGGP